MCLVVEWMMNEMPSFIRKVNFAVYLPLHQLNTVLLRMIASLWPFTVAVAVGPVAERVHVK
jgi:hypothetical protein